MPGLRTHLDRMDATFWDRAEIIGSGRLDAASTREALEVHLDNTYGISFDNDTLEMVVAESQHYPYFIQMWGKALCLALRDSKTTHIDMAPVDAARPTFPVSWTIC